MEYIDVHEEMKQLFIDLVIIGIAFFVIYLMFSSSTIPMNVSSTMACLAVGAMFYLPIRVAISLHAGIGVGIVSIIIFWLLSAFLISKIGNVVAIIIVAIPVAIVAYRLIRIILSITRHSNIDG